MIAHAGVARPFWAEAVATAAYLQNRVLNSAMKGNLSPYEKWYRRKPRVHHLQVFCCMAYAHVPDGERCKFDSKAKSLGLWATAYT